MQIGACVQHHAGPQLVCVFLGSALIVWKSKKQNIVSRSSAETEYKALATLTSELLLARQLLRAFEVPMPCTMFSCDSQSAIQLTSNPTCNKRSKHINIDCHFIREDVQAGFFKLVYVASQDQLADTRTKALPRPLFQA